MMKDILNAIPKSVMVNIVILLFGIIFGGGGLYTFIYTDIQQVHIIEKNLCSVVNFELEHYNYNNGLWYFVRRGYKAKDNSNLIIELAQINDNQKFFLDSYKDLKTTICKKY